MSSINNAVYRKLSFPEYQGNPLIEALPSKISDEGIIQVLEYFPHCTEEERLLNSYDRKDFLVRLKQLTQPLPAYINFFRMLETAIKDGYSTRNPFCPTTSYYLTYPCAQTPEITPSTGIFEPKGTAITVIGESGVGKSRMILRTLGFFPQIIQHSTYNDQELPIKQVVWLYIECSHDSTLRGLCHDILGTLDRALGTETKPERNIATLLDQIERRFKSSFLGVLVIDEIQAISIAKSGGADNLLNFLLHLINRCGVPIVLSGNPEATNLLQSKFRVARRVESGGFIEMKSLTFAEEWEYYTEELWELQWTVPQTPLTTELSAKLYQLSTGVLDIATRIFRKAQDLVIGSGDERITPEVLDRAYISTCQLTDSKLDIIRQRRAARKSGSNRGPHQSKAPAKNNKPPTYSLDDSGHEIILGDLTRPHHPEFYDALIELKHCVDLSSRIKDPDLFQRSNDEKHPLKFLKKHNVVCHDPLNHFSR